MTLVTTGAACALDPKRTTILRDNISWHIHFPPPTRRRGSWKAPSLALPNAGYQDVVCVQNKTVVTDRARFDSLVATPGN